MSDTNDGDKANENAVGTAKEPISPKSDSSESRARAPMRGPHPWHGLNPELAEDRLLAFVENTQHDRMKLEVDQRSGYLKVDYPLQTSALPPYAYGFIPRTLCGRRLASLGSGTRGDQAPLDVFILSEHPFPMAGVLAEIRVVGGIPTQDETRIDDKLIGILHRDPAFGEIEDIEQVPIHIMERIVHFVVQTAPDGSSVVGDPFGATRARTVLDAALADYRDRYDP